MSQDYWTDEQDAIVRSLWPDVKAIMSATGRRHYAVHQRASKLHLRTGRKRSMSVEQVERQQAVLAMLTAAARNGRQCPTNDEIGAKVGCAGKSAGGIVARLARSGSVIVTPLNGGRRTVEVPGVGITRPTAVPEKRRSPNAVPPKPLVREPAIRTPDRDDIFAGVVFEDAPVGRDYRRAPTPVTHVASRVEGAW